MEATLRSAWKPIVSPEKRNHASWDYVGVEEQQIELEPSPQDAVDLIATLLLDMSADEAKQRAGTTWRLPWSSVKRVFSSYPELQLSMHQVKLVVYGTVKWTNHFWSDPEGRAWKIGNYMDEYFEAEKATDSLRKWMLVSDELLSRSLRSSEKR